MHRALLIAEVLDLIFNKLVEEDPFFRSTVDSRLDTYHADQRTFARLARTCRAFFEPALNALWKTLDTLNPLIRCLPNRGPFEETSVDGTLYTFSDEDWSIVMGYAPRVRQLVLRVQDDSPSMQILQSVIFHTTVLLPNLWRLELVLENSTSMMASIRPLLGPSLIFLRMRFIGYISGFPHSSFVGFLQNFHVLCPNLKLVSFKFTHPSRFPSVTAAVSRAICRIPDPEMIICEPIDEAALIHISQSRSLESFTSDLGTYRPDDLKRIVTGLGSPDQPPFENLRVLDLLVEDLSCIIPILRPHHQPFTAVFIDCQPTLTPGVLPELLTALSSLPRRSSLRQLRLASPGGSEPITFQALLPLLSFNRLKVFDFDLANPIVMDDEELAQLAGAWPELETFHLNKLAGWSAEINTKLPTSKGFSTLLALCPKLSDLFLCVDMRDVSSSSMGEYPGEESRNTSLTTLMLVESPIEEPVSKVTEFLIKHAPSLTDLSVWSNEFLHEERYHTHYEPLWEKVRGQIREIKGLD